MKLKLPYRHYYYLKIFSDLRRVTLDEAIRFLYGQVTPSANNWIDARFANYQKEDVAIESAVDFVKENELMPLIQGLPEGIKPITDGPYTGEIRFFEEAGYQGAEILGYRIYDFKRALNRPKLEAIYGLVRDRLPFEMALEEYDVYRRIGSQFWQLVQTGRRAREMMPEAGETAMDVGAYVGHRALAMHYCAEKKGRVYAIEVEDENFELLKKNAAKNRFANFIPIQAAVDEAPRIMDLYTRDQKSMAHGLRPFEKIEDPSRAGNNVSVSSRKVKTTTLDAIFEQHRIARVDVMHISVTGHEIPVLKGIRQAKDRIRSLRVSCPYKSDGVPMAVTAREILEQKGFADFTSHGSALCCQNKNRRKKNIPFILRAFHSLTKGNGHG